VRRQRKPLQPVIAFFGDSQNAIPRVRCVRIVAGPSVRHRADTATAPWPAPFFRAKENTTRLAGRYASGRSRSTLGL
jgi:hypothetical protein